MIRAVPKTGTSSNRLWKASRVLSLKKKKKEKKKKKDTTDQSYNIAWRQSEATRHKA